jgi:hypothetical protein
MASLAKQKETSIISYQIHLSTDSLFTQTIFFCFVDEAALRPAMTGSEKGVKNNQDNMT